MFSDEDLKKSTVRVSDGQGRLVRAGFWWWEPRRRASLLLTAIVVILLLLCFVFGITGILAFGASKSTLATISLTLLALCIAGLVWTAKIGPRYTFFRRAAVFRDDGTMLMEHPEQPIRHLARVKSNLVPMRRGFANITTIEMKPGGDVSFGLGVRRTYCVCAYYSDGQEAVLSYNIVAEPVARLVVVQLNRALRDMRASIASRTVERPQVVN